MGRSRGASGLSGILLIDKPAGPTSHDVVSTIRRLTGESRVGHAGTLDPLATGLLVVLIGPFTRLEPYLSSARKSYLATVAFGSQTDTDDAEGAVSFTAPVPEKLLETPYARAALDAIIGDALQVPPAYSAIKLGGMTAHRAARAGKALDIAPRPINVSSAELISIQVEPPSWVVAFDVSKGTYIRALARDLGLAHGSAAHLASLRRTSSGRFSIDSAYTLDEVDAATKRGDITSLFADPFFGLGFPIIGASPDEVADGRSFPGPGDENERISVRVAGRLGGVYHRERGMLKADVFFPDLPRSPT